jgi:predicted dehydrogenase
LSATKAKIGIIGCGNISSIYFKAGKAFDNLHVIAAADVLPERAHAKALEFGVPKAGTVDELLADPDIEIVVNLTIPKAHAAVSRAALQAGKHVYVEKPFAVSRADGKELIELAKSRDLRIGCAPDTFLGGGLQTCRKLIDDGWIGEPVAATAFMLCHGHEHWHPDPAFYYHLGGGPMFDMGPYYLTALVSLIGPVKRLCGSARITFPERTITSTPKHGEKMKVETPTHIAGVMDFQNGAIGTLVTSFDVWSANVPRIEIYGTEGSLSVPDPNTFGGPVKVRKAGTDEWSDIPLTHGYAENSRGIGVADMAAAIRSGRPHRAGGDLAYHVLDIMAGFHDSSLESRHYVPETSPSRPDSLPLGLAPGQIEISD